MPGERWPSMVPIHGDCSVARLRMEKAPGESWERRKPSHEASCGNILALRESAGSPLASRFTGRRAIRGLTSMESRDALSPADVRNNALR